MSSLNQINRTRNDSEATGCTQSAGKTDSNLVQHELDEKSSESDNDFPRLELDAEQTTNDHQSDEVVEVTERLKGQDDDVMVVSGITRDFQTMASVSEIGHFDHIHFDRRFIDPTCFFRDGRRLIDMVIAYQPLQATTHEIAEKELSFQKYRNLFEDAMICAGLELEHEFAASSEDGRTSFVKIHAPWEVLCRNAELMQLKMPIREIDFDEDPSKIRLKCGNRILFHYPRTLHEASEEPERQYFRARFDRERMDMFLVEDRETFFSRTDRIKVVHYIISRLSIPVESTNQGRRKDSVQRLSMPEVGLHQLIKARIYCDVFPLHDSEHSSQKVSNQSEDQPSFAKKSYRRWLMDYWGSFRYWNQPQPLEHIRAYFGGPIALYFAWLGFYIQMLIFPAVVAILALFYGLATFLSDRIVNEVCNSNISMCRQCSAIECPIYPLNMTCSAAKFDAIVDTNATIVVAVIMSIWAVCFLQFWKRRQNTLTETWNIIGEEHIDDVMRHDYLEKVKTRWFNPVTGTEEAYLPNWDHLRRLTISSAGFILTFIFVMACATGLLIARFYTYSAYMRAAKRGQLPESIQDWGELITICSFACLNIFLISFIEIILKKVCWKLTEVELPRTESEFERSFLNKYMVLQFVNYFYAIFVLGFIRGRLAGSPNSQPFGRCPATGCFLDVSIQVVVLLFGKQIILSHICNRFFPCLTRIIRNLRRSDRVASGKTDQRPQWERDQRLEENKLLDLELNNYFDKVLQYGFITIFAAAFPLCSVFALANNIFQLRAEARSLCKHYRRPIPNRSGSIRFWQHCLTILTKLAVFVNALSIAVTSDFVDKLLFQHYPTSDTFVGNILSSFDTEDYDNVNVRYSTVLAWRQQNNHTNWSPLPRICFYKAYRFNHDAVYPQEKYGESLNWWISNVIRMTVIIAFIYFVTVIQEFVAKMIPAIPYELRLRKEREKYLTKKAFTQYESKMKEESEIWDRNARLASITGVGAEKSFGRYNYPRRRIEKVTAAKNAAGFWWNLTKPDPGISIQPNHNPVLQRMREEDENAFELSSSQASETSNTPKSFLGSNGNVSNLQYSSGRRRRQQPFFISLFKKLNIWC